jgi:hypothetical protein
MRRTGTRGFDVSDLGMAENQVFPVGSRVLPAAAAEATSTQVVGVQEAVLLEPMRRTPPRAGRTLSNLPL